MLGRDIRLFIRKLPAVLLLAVLLTAFCAFGAVSLSRGAQSRYTAAPVAVVDADRSVVGTMAVRLIGNQDFASPLKLVKATEKKAARGLADGSFSAVLYLPEGYAGAVLSGEDVQAKLILSRQAALHADVVQMLCDFGEDLLSTGQFGIFVGEPLVLAADPGRHGEFLDIANARYLSEAFTDDWFRREQVAYGGTGVTAEEWYGLLYAMTLFQILLLCFTDMGRDVTTQTLRRLRACGIGSGLFLGSKALLMYAFELVFAGGILLAAGRPVIPAGLAAVAAALAMTVLMGLAAAVCLDAGNAVSFVTVLSAAGLFCSGGILPRMELPVPVTYLGDLLPLGAAARLSACVYGGRFPWISAAAVLLWAAAAVLLMYARLRAVRKGAAT